MPEFILDHESPEASRQFAGLDSFTQGYIEAMFFTSEDVDSDCEPGHENDLADISVADLAPETLAQIMADCAKFQADNAALLARAYGVTGQYELQPYDESLAGNDFWCTRNGHGTGFWDRGQAVLDQLADAACHSTRDLYRGDDGKLYLS